MVPITHSLSDRLTALIFLGQARWLEWQALTMQTVVIEWTRSRQEWGAAGRRLGVPGGDLLMMGPLGPFADIAAAWCLWSVRGQQAAAQALLTHCALPYLDLPRISGRRAGFDPGRRRSAVVIDFPDRRRPEPIG